MCATNSISGLKERINSSNSPHFQRTEEEYTRKHKSQELRQKIITDYKERLFNNNIKFVHRPRTGKVIVVKQKVNASKKNKKCIIKELCWHRKDTK